VTDDRFTAAHRGGGGEPLVCLHGLMDTWRTWELVLPALERRHDVLAPTLAGHAGGPPLPAEPTSAAVVDAVESAMDGAGFATAHLVGNSLGGYVALRLAERGRAVSVVALAPAGGWAVADDAFGGSLMDELRTVHQLVGDAAAHADEIVATVEGRRRATEDTTVRFEHIPAGLLAHEIRAAAACSVEPLLESASRDGWPLDPERIACPVRIVWGTADRVLPWPEAAARHRERFPHADWAILDDVGHPPQLDVPLETVELILGFTAR